MPMTPTITNHNLKLQTLTHRGNQGQEIRSSVEEGFKKKSQQQED